MLHRRHAVTPQEKSRASKEQLCKKLFPWNTAWLRYKVFPLRAHMLGGCSPSGGRTWGSWKKKKQVTEHRVPLGAVYCL